MLPLQSKHPLECFWLKQLGLSIGPGRRSDFLFAEGSIGSPRLTASLQWPGFSGGGGGVPREFLVRKSSGWAHFTAGFSTMDEKFHILRLRLPNLPHLQSVRGSMAFLGDRRAFSCSFFGGGRGSKGTHCGLFHFFFYWVLVLL